MSGFSNLRDRELYYFEDDITPTFGLTDINQLARHFKKCVYFSTNKVPQGLSFESNIEIKEKYLNWEHSNSKQIIIRNVWVFVKALFYEFIHGGLKLKHLGLALKKLLAAEFKAAQIEMQLKNSGCNPENAVFYIFWFYDSTFLVFLKRRFPNATFINRTHSGDLYEDGPSLKGRTLLRNLQLNSLDAIITISNDAKDYVIKKYPKAKNKVHLGRLGTADPGTLNPFRLLPFTLVTCSHVRNVKRVHLVAQALQNIEMDVIWYHMGGVDTSNKVDHSIQLFIEETKALSQKPNITFINLGVLRPTEVFDFYRNTPVNLLISTSETEGIPVSMMEAISFGIPVLSSNVGGCKEIVTKDTGTLFPSHSSPQEIAELILSFGQSEKNTEGFRKGVRNFWLDNYSEDTNYNNLAEKINTWVA